MKLLNKEVSHAMSKVQQQFLIVTFKHRGFPRVTEPLPSLMLCRLKQTYIHLCLDSQHKLKSCDPNFFCIIIPIKQLTK